MKTCTDQHGTCEEDNCRCDKPFYISFGQSHAHTVDGVTFDKDSICQIDALNRELAQKRAFEVFGPKWCFVYDTLPNMSYFPRGVIRL